MLPIPGTKSLSHLEENLAAAAIQLDPSTTTALSALAPAGTDPTVTGVDTRR
jgi:hypothetical protein